MRSLFLIMFSFFIIVSCGPSKQLRQAQNMDATALKRDLNYLASDALRGRETGTEDEKKAGDYIAKQMLAAGLTGAGNNHTFVQTFPYTSNPHAMGIKDQSNPEFGINIVGFYNNMAKNTVIIGAHFDHLGMGGPGSLSTDKNTVHNGADDNGSGVVALLELARQAKDLKKDNNYLFIAFSGEEKGLYGSKYYAEHPTIDLSNVNYMINMDMVGRMHDNKLVIHGTGTSPVWNTTITEKNPYKLDLVLKPSGVGPSDHTSFYYQDLPVLHFFTGQHEDYHKPSDDVDKINFDGISLVINYIKYIINEVSSPKKLVFTKTKVEETKAAKFKVTLGVMPDYVYTGEGLKIDGVQSDRPAEKAGILRGDILIHMGDIEIKDIYKYMEALSKHQKGDTTKVKVKRGKEILEMDVTFE